MQTFGRKQSAKAQTTNWHNCRFYTIKVIYFHNVYIVDIWCIKSLNLLKLKEV